MLNLYVALNAYTNIKCISSNTRQQGQVQMPTPGVMTGIPGIQLIRGCTFTHQFDTLQHQLYTGTTSDDEHNTRYILSCTAGSTINEWYVWQTCPVVAIKMPRSLTMGRLYMGEQLLDNKPKASFTACHLQPIIATCFINNNTSSEVGRVTCLVSVLQHGQQLPGDTGPRERWTLPPLSRQLWCTAVCSHAADRRLHRPRGLYPPLTLMSPSVHRSYVKHSCVDTFVMCQVLLSYVNLLIGCCTVSYGWYFVLRRPTLHCSKYMILLSYSIHNCQDFRDMIILR